MSRPLRLQFVAENDAESGPLTCSQCEEEAPLLVKLAVVGLNDRAKPWVGLCRACVERIHRGFDTAASTAGRSR